MRDPTILSLIGRNVVSDSRGRKEEAARNRVRKKHVIGWNSTVLHPVLHPRLLDTIVFHRYLPSSVPNQQPLVAPSSLHWQPYERIYFPRRWDFLVFNHGDFLPVSQTFLTYLTRVYARPEIIDKLDGIKKFLPLEKNRARNSLMEYFGKSRGNPSLSQVERSLKSFLLKITCISARE